MGEQLEHSARNAEFYYDFNSPYAYLSAQRIDALMPMEVIWRPVAFGVIIRRVGKVPWSLSDPGTVEAGQRDCEERAAERGLPPLRWADGWPAETYSLTVLRAALVAERAGRLVAFSHAAFRQNFVHGRALNSLEVVLGAAGEAGVDEADVRAGVEDPEIKAELTARTDAAIADAITGIPTVVLPDGRRFWGDDRLDEAAAAARRA